MKIVIYARISSAKNYKSIYNQIKLAKQYIDMHNMSCDKDNIEEIRDVGYSGSNMIRPGIQKIIEYIGKKRKGEKNIVDIIIIKDISRLGRNYIEVGKLLRDIEEARIKLVCIHTDKEKDDSIDMDINTLLADFYSKDISIKTKSVLDMNKKKGIYSIGKVPFGYRKSHKDKNVIEIYEPEAKYVRKIYKMYKKGCSIKEIVEILNSANSCKKRKSKQYSGRDFKEIYRWDYQKVYRILHNDFYRGTMVYGKSIGHKWEGKKRRYIDKDNWIRIDNHHDAII